ncbi:MAG: ATP-binding protein [Planctomycetaceae bacterium]
MSLTLRHRIVLTLVPPFLLLTVLGVAGVVLLSRLGNSTRQILRENYDSVLAMERLNEGLERIDSSFQIALSGASDDSLQQQARRQYEVNWEICQKNLDFELKNITLPREAELAAQLADLTATYHRRGDEFYARPKTEAERNAFYYGTDAESGLMEAFGKIKGVKEEILRLNQSNMEDASRNAQRLAADSLIWFGSGWVVAVALAAISAWHTIRTILGPLRAVTQAAIGISEGNLDQVVPYVGGDELGQLAHAFNDMAHHLRTYRQSQSARLLRAQHTIQATIDSFPDAVLVIDFEGHVEMANPAARRLLGVVPMQRGSVASGIWNPPEPLRPPLERALRGEGDFLPEGFDRAMALGVSGRERTVLPRILTIRDPQGHTLGAAILLQDVTRFRLLDQIKSNLVATASHELKTPLTSIRLAVHVLLEEVVGSLTPKQSELLLDARENCERLLAMINNLLDLARLEQGARQLNISSVAPQTLLQAAADEIRARAADRSVEVVVDVPADLPGIAIDSERLRHALRNLLDNALTYTDRGGKITLKAAADNDAVTLSVADTGVGIPPEHLPQIFEKFFRVPGQSRGSGTGLGLAIVREIVTAHGGSITCESAPGEGAEFRLRLPVSAELPQPQYVLGQTHDAPS